MTIDSCNINDYKNDKMKCKVVKVMKFLVKIKWFWRDTGIYC